METFLATALSTADVDRACRAAGVEIGDYLRARRSDLAFDAECRELDFLLKLAIQQSMTAIAAKGDRGAARLVARGELEFRRELGSEALAPPGWIDFRGIVGDPHFVSAAGLSPFVRRAIADAYDRARRREADCRAKGLSPVHIEDQAVGWECPRCLEIRDPSRDDFRCCVCGRERRPLPTEVLVYCMGRAREVWSRIRGRD